LVFIYRSLCWLAQCRQLIRGVKQACRNIPCCWLVVGCKLAAQRILAIVLPQKSADLFALSPENIANVADTEFWGAERVIEQQRTLALLEFVRSRLDSELISAQELARLWRSAETEMDGIWVSGRVNYNELTERELNFVFDQLQVTVLAAPDKNDRRSSTRMKEFARIYHGNLSQNS
jgi:hypothetical protein